MGRRWGGSLVQYVVVSLTGAAVGRLIAHIVGQGRLCGGFVALAEEAFQ
jgi:hypothetical protein